MHGGASHQPAAGPIPAPPRPAAPTHLSAGGDACPQLRRAQHGPLVWAQGGQPAQHLALRREVAAAQQQQPGAQPGDLS